MDEATALQILKQYGAQPNPQNLMRVMQQGGSSDGSAVLGRSMGLQGGVDESGNALDKLAFASQRSAAAPTAPTAPVAPTPMPTAPVASAMTPTPIQPRQAAGPPEPYDVPEPTSVPVPTTNAGAGGDSPFWPWLLAALGASSTKGRSLMAPGTGGGVASAAGQALLEGPQARGKLTGPTPNQALPDDTAKLRLEGPQKQLTGSSSAPVDIMGNVTGSANEAVDNISKGTARPSESRRPINTNKDERNTEPSSKPTNLESPAPRPGPYDGEPTNLMEEVVKLVKRARR